jgi:hypothetical protein
MISASANLQYQFPVNENYIVFPIYVDVNTAEFKEGRQDEYFSKVEGTNEVKLKFCIKTDLGTSTVVDLDSSGNEIQGTSKNTPISYHKLKLAITIDMETGFSTDIEIEEETASTASKDAVIAYDCKLSQCDGFCLCLPCVILLERM